MDRAEELIERLGHPRWFVRWVSAEALGRLGDARAIDPLIVTIRDNDSDMRRASAQALGEIGDARAIEPLIVALADEDSNVRRAAGEALGRIGDARAVDSLISILRDENTDVNDVAVKALVKIGKASTDSLVRVLSDHRGPVRAAAAEALGNIGDVRAVDPLFAACKDGDEATRKAVANALEEIQKRLPAISKDKSGSILCIACFCRFTECKAQQGFRYYACRSCHRLLFIDNVTRVIAVLDHSLDKPHTHNETALLVNWYLHKAPFDFDEIRIVDANDFDIDELVMKLKNDMDDKRRRKYKSMVIHLAPQVQPSVAQMHMLKGTFGRVENVD